MGIADEVWKGGKPVQRECEHHGPYTAELIFGRAPCPQCVAESKRQHDAQVAQDVQAGINRAIIQSAQIPKRYRNARIGDFLAEPHDRAAAFVRAVQAGEFAQMLVVGPVGTGKTHYAAAITYEFARHGVNALYSTAAGYLREIRDTWGDPERSEARVFDRYAKCPALVLDDMGAGTEGKNDVWRLHELIDARYCDELPTVYASNLTASELKRWVGDRTFDRMKDGAVRLALMGDSRRAAVDEDDS